MRAAPGFVGGGRDGFEQAAPDASDRSGILHRVESAGCPIAEVAVPLPPRKTFHYAIPERLREAVRPGVRLRVPFGSRSLVGVCVGLLQAGAGTGETGEARAAAGELKPIEAVLDVEPALSPSLLELTRFVADYYRCSWGEALASALPASVRRRAASKPRVLAAAAGARGAPAPPPADTAARAPDLPGPPAGMVLTEGQERALEAALSLVREGRFGVVLVHGVTGSGKTEIYLRAAEETIRLGRRVILLVPEIALTPQTVERLRARLGEIGLLHSMQTPAERARQWERIRAGGVRAVVGPRSAVFAPLPQLGLIVVDEEHEASYKQETAPRYGARDVAIARARIEGAAALLGSATPSLESYHNARTGRYRGVYLEKRAQGARLPSVEVVDLRAESREVRGFPFISRRLEQALRECLGRGEQAILFLNRRGFSTFLTCKRCGEVLTCGQCSVALTYHKERGQAICHYCEKRLPPPTECPRCLGPEIRYFGFGTERIEEEVRRRFDRVRVRRVDSDAIDGEEALSSVLGEFGRGEVDVLIGTQMVAKGLDFPRVSLVGVIFADTALNFPDFRASERTFQLLAQVAGRAGRAEVPGRTVIQTFSPLHPAIRAARTHDSLGFLEIELEHRRALGYPPFGRLLKLVVSGTSEAEVARDASLLAAHLEGARPEGAKLLGPAPAPIAVARGRTRYLIVVKARDRSALRPMLAALDTAPRLSARVRLAVDVDPASML